jgi:hypothetical protein
LSAHLDAYRDGTYRLPHNERPLLPLVLPVVLAEALIFALPHGVLSDLLREQNFRWHPDEQFPKVLAAVVRVLDNADFSGTKGDRRRKRLEHAARKCIVDGLCAFGVVAPKDLFRDRRSA